MPKRTRSVQIVRVVVALALIASVVFSFGTSHSRLLRLAFPVLLLITLAWGAVDQRRRLAETRCPHDQGALRIRYRWWRRTVLTCTSCGRDYVMYGPKLYEAKREQWRHRA